MIENATLTKMTPTAAADRFGNAAYGAGVVVSLRCAIVSPTSHHRHTLGDLLKDVTAVCYIEKASMPASAPRPAAGMKIEAAVDDAPAATVYEVLHELDQQKAGGLAHFECLLKAV